MKIKKYGSHPTKDIFNVPFFVATQKTFICKNTLEQRVMSKAEKM